MLPARNRIFPPNLITKYRKLHDDLHDLICINSSLLASVTDSVEGFNTVNTAICKQTDSMGDLTAAIGKLVASTQELTAAADKMVKVAAMIEKPKAKTLDEETRDKAEMEEAAESHKAKILLDKLYRVALKNGSSPDTNSASG